MKQVFLFLFIAALAVACNNSGDNSKGGDSTQISSATTEGRSTADLPYQVKDWGDWQPGSMENLKTVLNSLKNWEKGDVDAALKDFADSVELRFDNWIAKLPKDSFKTMFASMRKGIANMHIDMDDYETVKSKNGKEEWVSMWYKQTETDSKGKVDSAVYMDDLRIVNGKIAVLDEKKRSLPAKK